MNPLTTAIQVRPALGQLVAGLTVMVACVLAACGGGGGVPPAGPVRPAIVQQPSDVAADVGTPAVFIAEATGKPAPQWQWQRSEDSGRTWTDLRAANAATLTLPAVTAGDQGVQFRAVASNSAGQAVSNAASLRVTESVKLLAGRVGGAWGLDGLGTGARLWGPASLATAGDGTIYFAESLGREAGGALSSIRSVSPRGQVNTLALPSGYYSAVAVDVAHDLIVVKDARATMACGGAHGRQCWSSYSRSLWRVSLLSGATTLLLSQTPYAIAVATDSQQNIFLSLGTAIHRLAPDGGLALFAGSSEPGAVDGSAGEARFGNVTGMAVDSAGNLIVADAGNHTIRSISPVGQVSTIAGRAGEPGSVDGPGAAARFNSPSSLVVAPTDEIFVADAGNHQVRRIGADGRVATVAGVPVAGEMVDGPIEVARFQSLGGIALGAQGHIVVADSTTLRTVDAQGSVHVLAGLPPGAGYANGQGSMARFRDPVGLAVGAAGEILVADLSNFLVRRIAADGTVNTMAGIAGRDGSSDGPPGVATFFDPGAIAANAQGRVLVADHWLRQVERDGTVSSLFASAVDPSRVGTPPMSLHGIAMTSSGTVFVADGSNDLVRRISASNEVSIYAGVLGVSDLRDGGPGVACFRTPKSITVDPLGNVYIGESTAVRKITVDGFTTTLAGTLAPGSDDGLGPAARFESISGLAVDASGTVYVIDAGKRLRKITPHGQVTTVYQQGVRISAVAALTPGRIVFSDEDAIYVASIL